MSDDQKLGDGQLVIVTDAAREKIREIMEMQNISGRGAIRVGIAGRGPAGFNYSMSLEEDAVAGQPRAPLPTVGQVFGQVRVARRHEQRRKLVSGQRFAGLVQAQADWRRAGVAVRAAGIAAAQRRSDAVAGCG